MKPKILILLLFALTAHLKLNAQRIEGQVYESVGGEAEPLVGANLQWMDTQRGTSTDTDGNFGL